jgi:GTP-binding protein
MLIKFAEFVKSAVKPEHYPEEDQPEIAFAGRSNVGKSSLINTLVNRKKLVKTSSTPGRTQLINFFSINERFTFVDLPGYGYAKVPKKISATWGPMIEKYLTTRKTLRGIVVLLDIRRTPGEDEKALRSWLEFHRIPAIYVLTKADKLSKTKQNKQLTVISDAIGLDQDSFVLFSSKSRLGKEQLLNRIEVLIQEHTA